MRGISITSLCLTLLTSFACMTSAAHADLEIDAGNYVTPTKKIDLNQYPIFSDDYDFRGMGTAIQRQLQRYSEKRLVGTIELGGHKYPLARAEQSLLIFHKMVDAFQACLPKLGKTACYTQFNAQMRADFNVFEPNLTPQDPRYGQPDDTFFTGYHTHTMEATTKPAGDFVHAIYANPEDPKLLAKSRDEIDFHKALSGHGLELAYITNLFDLYLLHVEGSGLVTFHENGKVIKKYLSYDGTNSQHWEFISKYMMAHGMISNPSIAAQRKYLRLHPDKQEEIYKNCPSYVFFKYTDQPPDGCDQTPLTDGRSIATDISLYAFKGLITYIQTNRPEENGHYDFEIEDPSKIKFVPFSRFVLDQDTGGAIRGKGRADIYFGTGDYAFFAATYTAQLGKIRFLMLKDGVP